MKNHQLKLASEPFDSIRSGNKTIESRLYDEKRRLIELGDQLIFTNRENVDQTLTARVIGLLRYESFEELFAYNQPEDFGGPSSVWLLNQIREFYAIEEEQKYGVIGIRFVLA